MTSDLNLWLTIPTGNRRQYLGDLIRDCGIPKDKIVIVHTVESEPIPEVHNLWDLDEVNIHRWWNKGIDYAKEHGAEYVAVLNDDVKIYNKLALTYLAYACKIQQASMAILGNVPNSGHCFVLNLKDPIRPDERFRWWYGDNDLYLQAVNLNGLVNVPGLSIEHMEPNKLTIENPDLNKLTWQDVKEFRKKWNDVN